MPILAVAPHWGAWIEIALSYSLSYMQLSHPTGVRGLKSSERQCLSCRPNVAPHWGAWIEMSSSGSQDVHTTRRTPLGCVD